MFFKEGVIIKWNGCPVIYIISLQVVTCIRALHNLLSVYLWILVGYIFLKSAKFKMGNEYIYPHVLPLNSDL